ncbi:MAG: hypothetical protein MR704_20145 [Clostridia bacterium]|nr:hypothetical protein [Clostridia bacterium]
MVNQKAQAITLISLLLRAARCQQRSSYWPVRQIVRFQNMQLSDELKQKQVHDILVTSISCNKNYSEIVYEQGKILTGQKYYGAADEDMSDFAVGFYEIIYQDILDQTILDEKGKFVNKEFAGDTMNSFASIANITSNAGKTNRSRTPKSKWPIYLQNYYETYHCLANFWLLPMNIGRTSKKLNYYDSMDLFLNRLKQDYSTLSDYKDYFEKISTFEDYCQKHFVKTGRGKSEILKNYQEGDSENLVKYAMKDIEERASSISISKYADDLWAYFHKLNLC